VLRRPDDCQNRCTTSRSLKMSAHATASSGAGLWAAALTRMSHRLAFAVSLTVLLAGADVSAGGEDGPMASAPLPPPLPATPPATGSPQPAPSSASRAALPRSRPRTESNTHAAHLHERSNRPHHVDHFARAARGQKQLGQRAVGDAERRETYTVPQVANATTPPLAPLPFPYGYFPGAPPAYGYRFVYPPPWPPGPVLPH
jgi:hypothetical protein